MPRPSIRLLRAVAAALLASAVAGPSGAQAPGTPRTPAPFDMAPERRAAPPTAAPPGAPAGPGSSFSIDPAAPARPAPVQTPARAAAASPAVSPLFKPLLPAPRLTLEGEQDSRSWAFYLTQDEAEADVSFDVAFQNAVVVMPEASRLHVFVNGEKVLEAPIASAERAARVSSALRKGLLRSGRNIVRFEVLQRHRTDCTVASTFELWTRIENAGTGLTFRNTSAGRLRLRNVDDLPAVGADLAGRTTLNIVAPSAARTVSANRIFAVAQAVALRGRYSHVVVNVSERPVATPGPGQLNIVLATTAELQTLLERVPPELQAGRGFVGIIDDSRFGPSTLMVSGSSWQEVDAAVESTLVAPVTRPPGISRIVMDTASWHVPDAPYIADARRISFADLGIPTQESSGRRFRTRALIALPGDLYAQAYGNATLYLDAAYSREALPGDSHIEIYANGRIAATVPLNNAGGDFLQHFPITVPLRNFRPGVNEIWLEAVTPSRSDIACAPGATLPGANRFVLFETSEFVVPDFGKIGVLPNLAATAGTAFPYVTAPQVGLVLGRHDPANYSAAATLLARLAVQASRPLQVNALTSVSGAGDQPVIAVGAAGQFPSGVLPRVGVAENVRTAWPARSDAVITDPANGGAAVFDAVIGRFQERQNVPPRPADDQGGEDVRDRWRGAMGGPLARQFAAFDAWLQRTFELSFAQLRSPVGANQFYEPANGTDLIVAQAVDAPTRATWTAFVIRREEALQDTVARLTMPTNWTALSGRITAFQGTQGFQTVAADENTYVLTRAFSIANLRLVAANWMSSNFALYALALVACCIGLGIGTFTMLGRLGRRA